MGSLFYSKRLPRARDGKFPRAPRVRPKTFKSEEHAKRYAELKGIKSPVVKQKGKKFVIEQTA